MGRPVSLDDLPHVRMARRHERLPAAPQQESGVVVRTLLLSLAALLAPILAGATLGAMHQPAPSAPAVGDQHPQERPFELATAEAQPTP